jgi:hypothetical protein
MPTELPPPTEIRITPAETQLQQQVVTTPPPPTLLIWDSHGGQHYLVTDAMVSAEVEQKFRALAEEWYMDTMPLSSYVEKILHPAYQKILVLGTDAVPFIMDEIRDMPNDWFWALRMLTDADPVRSEEAGNMQIMTSAWLHWWEHEGRTWRLEHGL